MLKNADFWISCWSCGCLILRPKPSFCWPCFHWNALSHITLRLHSNVNQTFIHMVFTCESFFKVNGQVLILKPVPFRDIVDWTPSSSVLMRALVHGLLRAGWLRFLVSAADFLTPVGMEEPSMIKFPFHISQSWPWCPRSYKPSRRWTGCKHALRECKALPAPQDSWTLPLVCTYTHTHTVFPLMFKQRPFLWFWGAEMC